MGDLSTHRVTKMETTDAVTLEIIACPEMPPDGWSLVPPELTRSMAAARPSSESDRAKSTTGWFLPGPAAWRPR